jgi:four helix bundle protein
MNRTPAQTFEDLTVWQKAHQFVLSVYQLSENFPQKEAYGLTAQFRRAAMSIPANIAEGFKKMGLSDKVRFLNIAQGSLEECRYYLILSRDLKYGSTAPMLNQIEEVSKLLGSYSGAIRRKNNLIRGIALSCLLIPLSCLLFL